MIRCSCDFLVTSCIYIIVVNCQLVAFESPSKLLFAKKYDNIKTLICHCKIPNNNIMFILNIESANWHQISLLRITS